MCRALEGVRIASPDGATANYLAGQKTGYVATVR